MAAEEGLGPAGTLALGPALVPDFAASFALPELTPGAQRMHLELPPRRVRPCGITSPVLEIDLAATIFTK